MTFELPPLPYGHGDLAPHMSEETLNFHYGKHHQTYVTNLNGLVEGTDMANQSLEEIIQASANDANKAGLFNNAAQIWNHTFFWHCLSPRGGGEPTGSLAEKINSKWGDFATFKAEFKQAALTQFGSGWAWLVQEEDGSLNIMKTANADTPMAHGKKALFTVDVWEHAYYLDFQNRRPDFVDTVMNHLANWEFVTEQLS